MGDQWGSQWGSDILTQCPLRLCVSSRWHVPRARTSHVPRRLPGRIAVEWEVRCQSLPFLSTEAGSPMIHSILHSYVSFSLLAASHRSRFALTCRTSPTTVLSIDHGGVKSPTSFLYHTATKIPPCARYILRGAMRSADDRIIYLFVGQSGSHGIAHSVLDAISDRLVHDSHT